MMATETTDLLSQLSDDFLQCKICLEPYRWPKLLSCLHTFCQECLEKLHKLQDEPQHLECPTCRYKTELPGSGVSVLKDNFFVESLKNWVKLHQTAKEAESEGVVCGLCDSGEEAVELYCVECRALLCERCITVHGRITANSLNFEHQLMTMDQVRSATGLKAAQPRTRPCKLHSVSGEALKFYCETCGEAVCRDCLMVEHKDHPYTHLAEAAGGIKEQLSATLDEADKRLTELKDKQKEILGKKSLLKDIVTQVEANINEAAEQTRQRLVNQVNAEQKDLLQQVQDIEKKTEKEFFTVEDGMETTIVGLSNAFGRNVVVHGTDLDIISVKTEVQSRLQSLLQLSPDGICAPEGEPWVRFVADCAKTDDLVLLGEVTKGFSATFTTLGTTGRLGPTDLGKHYRGQDHEGRVTLQDGIQLFTVKHSGLYKVEAAGAAAGWGEKTPKSTRGRGAVMKGTFQLKKGEILRILVGQEGVQDVKGRGVGGGGGTFVTQDDNTPLIIAGGGGGGNGLSERKDNSDGNTDTSGNPSTGGMAGGTGGAGAVQGATNDVGGGGGGLLTDGASGESKFGGKDGRNGGEGGRAFVNIGVGGRGCDNNADGGFGGGGGGYGGCYGGGGGGGGYSGGGRGDDGSGDGYCGGGGGSFNSGGEPSGEKGANDGPGYVVITLTG